MRELKFRVWDYDSLEMVYNVSIPSEYNGYIEDSIGKEREWFLMQYTGLKDKNGKEVYESDIVQREGDWPPQEVKMEWMDVDAFEVLGWNVWTFIGDYDKIDGARIQSEIEVIGNIHENEI